MALVEPSPAPKTAIGAPAMPERQLQGHRTSCEGGSFHTDSDALLLAAMTRKLLPWTPRSCGCMSASGCDFITPS